MGRICNDVQLFRILSIKYVNMVNISICRVTRSKKKQPGRPPKSKDIEILQQSLSAHRHLSEWRVRESASLYNPTNFDAIFLRNGGDNQHKNLRGIWHRWDEYVIIYFYLLPAISEMHRIKVSRVT